MASWHEEPISKKHDRGACELGGVKTFLAIDDHDKKSILGFYSLSPASVEYSRTPEILKRGLARLALPTG